MTEQRPPEPGPFALEGTDPARTESLLSRLDSIAAGVAGAVRSVARDGLDIAGDLVEGGRQQLQASLESSARLWDPESPDQLLSSSPVFQPPPLTGRDTRLNDVRWRSTAIFGLSSLGLASFEDDVIHLTRKLLHDDLTHRELSTRLFGDDFGEVHRWIDTIPGRTYAGGGPTHRLAHGHDTDALAAIYEEHGLQGALVWMQHAGQDFMTPTGIPVPGGSTMAEWLVDKGGMGPRAATLAVSLNAVELAAMAFSGVFLLRLCELLRKEHRKGKMKRRIRAAERAEQHGDLDGCRTNLGEAYSLSDQDPTIAMALGHAYAKSGRPRAESFLYFRRAARDLALKDRAVAMSGPLLSLRGCAYLLALTHAAEIWGSEETPSAWSEELEEMIRSGVVAFEQTGFHFLEGTRIPLSGGKRIRARPLSAAANLYFASRMALIAPFAGFDSEAERLATSALDTLSLLEDVYEEHADGLRAVRESWEVQLMSPPHGGKSMRSMEPKPS